MTELHYPSPAIAPSNSQVGINGAIGAPSVRGEMGNGVGTQLGAWPTRLTSTLAA